FEYGCAQRGDEAGSEPGRFDLGPFITGTNLIKRAVPALNAEGPQLLVSHQDDPLLALLRESENRTERALILVNTQEREARQVAVEDLLAAAGLSYLGDRLAL